MSVAPETSRSGIVTPRTAFAGSTANDEIRYGCTLGRNRFARSAGGSLTVRPFSNSVRIASDFSNNAGVRLVLSCSRTTVCNGRPGPQSETTGDRLARGRGEHGNRRAFTVPDQGEFANAAVMAEVFHPNRRYR